MEPSLCCKVVVAAASYGFDKPYSYLVPEGYLDSLRPGMRVIVPFGRGNRRTEGFVLELSCAGEGKRMKYLSAVLDEQPVVDESGIRLALWMRERYFCTVFDAVKAMLPAGLYHNLQDEFSLAPGYDRTNAYEVCGPDDYARRILDLLFAAGGKLSRRALQEAFGGEDPTASRNHLLDAGVILLTTSASRGVGDKQEEIAQLAVPAPEAQQAVSSGRSKLRRSVVELLCQTGSASAKDIAYFTGARMKTLRELEKMGVVELFRREVFRRPELNGVASQPCPVLSPRQKEAYEGLCALQDGEKAACALLYGVTGSGKTAVYISLIHRTLAMGRTALVLVPEIGLTPQLLRSFAAQFGDQVAVLHSSLSAGERYDEWKRARQGKARVVIGTRSAVFAPLPDLGLLVLDEEQESSYKSENQPRYHAREVAQFRCARNRALLVLGSATPSVESMFFARSGKYHLFTLDQRYNQHALPRVMISDQKEELRAGNSSCISSMLRQELEENLRRGEQSILFLNRRGTSRMVLCAQCGEVPECTRCSVKLTYHKANGRLMCHYCGHSEPLPVTCPKCGGQLTFAGAGTQKIEEELNRLFPQVPVLRMDADTISASNTHAKLFDRFQREKIPILLGTQMVAKGLDFPNVTLVGVIDADLTLYTEDFRAGERTFSLLTQVVGRAGRGQQLGRAVIQTYTPKNEIITAAAGQDYDSFYENEILLRQIRRFPPFEDLMMLTFSGEEEGAVLRSSMRLRDGLNAWMASPVMEGHPFAVLGPAPAGIVRVNGRYRYRLTVCGKNDSAMRRMISHLLQAAWEDKENKGVSVFADVNPSD